jgi:hypothetical protein
MAWIGGIAIASDVSDEALVFLVSLGADVAVMAQGLE